MTASRRFAIVLLLGATGLIGVALGGRLSLFPGMQSIIPTAQAPKITPDR